MGGTESKDSDKLDSHYFTDEEKEKIKAIFDKTSSNKHIVNVGEFSSLCKILPKSLSERLFQWILSLDGKKHEGISSHQFTRCLGILLRGTITERSSFVLFVASGGKEKCGGEDLVKFVGHILTAYLNTLSHGKEYKSWKIDNSDDSVYKLSLNILEDLFYSGPVKDKGMKLPEVPSVLTYTEAEIEDWLSKSSMFLQILDQVLNKCFKINSDSHVNSRFPGPRLPVVSDIDWSKFRSVLDLPSLLYLNSTLPSGLQTEWRLLFSNCLHGDSFVQLYRRIISHGPTLILVKEKSGGLFGGFSNVKWERNSNFYGDPSCYLFQLKPHLSVYSPTGYNAHYVYLNQHVQTLPNGLGFGGQLDYFGLWIDQSFSSGHSKAGPRCTTYGSPQLSQATEFEVDTIEVWEVGPEKKTEDEEDLTEEEIASRKSILDKDPGAKAMLSLIGKGPLSEGLREGDETADSPEEHTANTVISLF